MPRRVTVISLAATLSAVALPAAAEAANTYTVDGTAADGCSTAKVCKTVTQAVTAVADGDTISIGAGTFNEPGKIALTKKNVNIVGVAGKTTITSASTTAGDPVITLIQGDILDGVTVQTSGAAAGPGILITGRDSTVKNGAIIRLATSSQDKAAYLVDPTVAAGTSTITAETIINGAGASAQTQPAVLGNGTSTLAIDSSVVLSGANNGPAVGLTGNDVNGSAAVPNTITRSALIASKPASDALTVTGAATSAIKKAVTLDTSLLLPGTSAAPINVSTAAGAIPGNDTSGDIKVVANHITSTGGKAPFTVAAGSGGQTAAGNIDLTFDRSIVHATGQGTATSYVPALPVALVSGVANTAKVTFTTSDAPQTAATASSGKGAVVLTNVTNTPDAKLFVDAAKQNTHLRADAPVIDRGGDLVAGEATKDIDGQDRKVGAATDLGADEFVNRAPTAVGTASASKVLQNATVTFDASKSTDPEAATGGSIAKYVWSFGDGSTAETTTPSTTHAYSELGLYTATVVAVDNFGASSAAAEIPAIAVSDGTAPIVTVTGPKNNASLALFKSKKVGKKTVKTLNPTAVSKVTISGTATDPQGVKLVLVSIRRLAVGTAAVPTNPKACVYLDGKTTFKSSACKKPVFFNAQLQGTAFSYKLKKALKPKAGKYELTIYAVDGSGVFSKPTVVPFKIK